MTLLSAALSKAIPGGVTRYRKVKFGISKGCYLPVDLTRQVRLLLGVYEVEIAARFLSWVSSDSCCYDVGASEGYYTLAFARLAPEGTVYALEMREQACETLRETLTRNATMERRVRVLNCTAGRYADEGRGVASIDDLVFKKRLNPPDIVKMDIEGAEGDVLEGSAEVLKQYHPYLIVETHSLNVQRRCIELLRTLDYDVEVIKRNRIMLENRPMEHNEWVCAS